MPKGYDTLLGERGQTLSVASGSASGIGTRDHPQLAHPHPDEPPRRSIPSQRGW